ncbi:MAG: cell wall hydrolase [Acidobacteria bacterium]|nr:cell wall hydrolase [Acidobacteriota bacterium]
MTTTSKASSQARQETNTLPLPDPEKSLAQQAPDILLAMCLFGEARGEDDRTRRAVAQVVLNRARHPHRVFGSRRDAGQVENLRRVILKPWQFSCFNPDDPNYAKLLRPLDYEEPAVWARCLECAREALAAAGQPDTLTANSDHYFDDSLQPPSWASPAKQTARIGRLRFYRLYLPALGRDTARPGQDGRTLEAAPPQSPSWTLLAAAPAARRRLPAFSAKRGATAGASPPVSLPASRHPHGRIYGLMTNRWFSGSGRLSLLLLLGAVLSGCSDFERAAYRTLAVTQAEYETVQQRAVEAFLHGLMTEDQWNRFEVEAHRFIEAHNAAVDAFDLWSRTKNKSNEARLQAMLEILPRLVREINTLVESFEWKTRQVVSSQVVSSQDRQSTDYRLLTTDY